MEKMIAEAREALRHRGKRALIEICLGLMVTIYRLQNPQKKED